MRKVGTGICRTEPGPNLAEAMVLVAGEITFMMGYSATALLGVIVCLHTALCLREISIVTIIFICDCITTSLFRHPFGNTNTIDAALSVLSGRHSRCFLNCYMVYEYLIISIGLIVFG